MVRNCLEKDEQRDAVDAFLDLKLHKTAHTYDPEEVLEPRSTDETRASVRS
jgi:hypothetical protein